MKGINTSIFDFPTLRDPKTDYVYVDKTKQLYEIAKPNAELEAALKDQIRAQCEKNYAAPYAADPRAVWYVAINYSAATRTLDDPLCERVS